MEYISKRLILGLGIIFFSTTLGVISVKFFTNLTDIRYQVISDGFISSYKLIGFLVSCSGLMEEWIFMKNKDNKKY